jgi:anti-sigma B factor antagonist
MAPQPQYLGVLSKEPRLKIEFDVRTLGETAVMHCKGRITYRDEALAFSRKVEELSGRASQLVLEMSAVEMIDSAGLGELVSALHSARQAGCELRLAAPARPVLTMLQLTNLLSVLEIHSSVDDAVMAVRGQMA